jgi:HK97 family phage major capsid protein
MIFGVDPKRLRNAKWLCHRTLMPTLLNLEDTNGNLIFAPANGGAPASLLGFPVANVEQANSLTDVSGEGNGEKPYLLLGDTKNSYIGDKADFSIKISEDGTVGGDSLFERDLSAIRVTERVGFNKGLTAAYSVLSSAVEAGS